MESPSLARAFSITPDWTLCHMPLDRASGLLLHISSLDSAGGIGDFGPAAYADIIVKAVAKAEGETA